MCDLYHQEVGDARKGWRSGGEEIRFSVMCRIAWIEGGKKDGQVSS
jgi:hypothetical protein